MHHRALIAACCMLALTSCGDSSSDDTSILEGERYAVLLGKDGISADPIAQTSPVDVPPANLVPSWPGSQTRSVISHIAITSFDDIDSATVGDGYDFTGGIAPEPVASYDTIYAMDASGHITAHTMDDIDQLRWESASLAEENNPEMLGGGLFLDEVGDMLYAASGYGQLAALDAKTGKEAWRIRLGAPIRGAPVAYDGIVVVITANNETIGLRASDGQTKWEHRGIRENAGFFSTVSPNIWQGIVLVAYSSGEVLAFNMETGNVVWTDTLITDNRTQAAAAFTGVNATPLVQDGVAYLISASGNMVANAVLNGRPLWEAEIGSAHSLWGAGNMVFALTTQNQLVAILKTTGKVHWVADLSYYNDDGFDITPRQFAPLLMNEHVCVADIKGRLKRVNVRTGERAPDIDIADDIAAAPISVGGRFITLHQNAQLRVSAP